MVDKDTVRTLVREEIKKQINNQIDENIGRWARNTFSPHHGFIGVFTKGNKVVAVVESKKGFEVIDIRLRNEALRGSWHKKTFEFNHEAINALEADGYEMADPATRDRILNRRSVMAQISAAIAGAAGTAAALL